VAYYRIITMAPGPTGEFDLLCRIVFSFANAVDGVLLNPSGRIGEC
jgi:hypothetical protein